MSATMAPDRQSLWGVVLAAGDGQRVQAYVRHLKGEALAKQYVNFVGTRSMLEHTLKELKS